jgi:hypothetical protein
MESIFKRINDSFILQAAAVYAVFLPVALFVPAVSWLWGLIAFSCFTVFAPIIAGLRTKFWAAIGEVVLSWIVLFAFIVQTIEARQKLGEGAMVFLLPIMLFPAALLLALIIHLARRSPNNDR